MKKKTRKILLYIFTAIFVAALMLIAATNARYVSMQSPSSDSVIGGNELQYTIAEQCEVTNQNELKAAIENGYSNIKITSDDDEPFYVSGEDLELEADLILDLNGHEIQCITREPIITVGSGNRLLVTDTSESGTGSFYNPVGSVLYIYGGTLSATSGKYESGPRKSEYYSNKNDNGYTGGYILEDDTVTVTYQRETNGASLATANTESAQMPILYPNGNSGNVYFDIAYRDNGCSIDSDTYLYLITADTASTLADSNKADFYYTYYLNYNESTGEYSYSGIISGEIFVTVCGFYNDITVAKNTNTTFNNNVLDRDTSNFAAIKMESGYLYVRGGYYYSYFGVSSAYCVSTTGGTIGVYDGFFEAIEAGVCVRCADSSALLYVYDGDFYSYKGNMVEVLNGAMTVTGGTFTKDATAYTDNQAEGGNNSAIYLDGGTMTVSGSSNALVEVYINGSYIDAIKCTSGTIAATYAEFIYNGGSSASSGSSGYVSNVGIANYGGTVTVNDCLFDTNDGQSKGIKSESGTITATGSFFVLSGEESIGIYANAGTVNVGNAQDTTRSCMFYIDHVANCYGVYAETVTGVTGTLEINVNGAEFIMGQQYYSSENTVPAAYTGGSTVINGAGVYLNDSNGTLNLKRAVFLMAGSYTAGVYAAAGTITQDDGSNDYTCAFLIGVKHSYYSGAGISGDTSFAETKFGNNYFVAKYGSAYPSNTQYTALSDFYTIGTSTTTASTTDGSTAIAAFQFSECETTSAIGSYGMFSDGGTITAEKVYVALLSTYGSGIYSEGGEITVNDFECDVRATDSGVNVYPGATSLSTDINSTAITVTADTNTATGSVTILKSNVNTDSYGYLVSNGSLIFGDDTNNTYANTLVSARATAILITGGDLEIKSNAELTVTSNIATKDSSNNNTISLVDKSGSMLTNFNGVTYTTDQNDVPEIAPDGIYISGGDLKSYGTLNVTLSGADNYTADDDYVNFTITSYAVRVVVADLTADINVVLYAGTITSYIGGGVYVNNSSNNNVYKTNVQLGDSGVTDNTKINIMVNGLGETGTATAKYSGTSISSSGWTFKTYKQCGHAVRVDNGELVVYNGTYNVTSASNGNGIYVSGSSSSVSIYGGVFEGTTQWSASAVGPGASYSLKVLEGNVAVYGGTFDSANGNCAFVMGSSSVTSEAYFYGGSYVSSSSRGILTLGYADVVIGGSGYTPEISGPVYGIGVEAFDNQTGNVAYSYSGTLTIESGKITSYDSSSNNANAVWYGNNNITLTINGGELTSTYSTICTYGVWNQLSGATIIINGGTITSNSAAGINLGNSSLTITGGTISGATYGIYFVNYEDYSNYTEYTLTYDLSIKNATIYGATDGIRITPAVSGAITIGDSTATSNTTTIYSSSGWNHGICFVGSLSNNVNIINSKITSEGSGYGIRFESTVFSASGYTFTIDSSEIYGGSGICFASGTGSYGEFKITNGSKVYTSTSYDGIEINGAMAMALTIDGSGTTVTGYRHAIGIGNSSTGSYNLSGSITVSNSATMISTNNHCIYVSGNFASGATITLWGKNALYNGQSTGGGSQKTTYYMVYVSGDRNGRIDCTGSTVTANYTSNEYRG